jgi:hypothetical protein
MTSWLLSRGIATALLAAGWLTTSPAIAQITPEPIPPGHEFPTPKAVIDHWIETSDAAKIRAHAWDLWGGMTVDSGQSYDGQALPIWETWYGSEEVFPASGTNGVAAASALLKANRAPPRAFISPNQFRHLARLRGSEAVANGPSDIQVVSFNKFDPSAADFIVKPHKGPDDKVYFYNNQTGLDALNVAWPPATTGEKRGIDDFPDPGIETKPVMGLVSATGLTPQPLWQGLAGSTNQTNPTPNTWTTCVLVDPKGTGGIRPATAAEIAGANPSTGLACKTYLYGPLSLFYSFPMNAAEAAAFNSAQQSGAKAGDYAVLVAMHVNTKETNFWTWQTFYWQPGADTPNGFPGSKAGQPFSLSAPWNNYAACTAYDQTTKPHGTTMTICFNPYLETSSGIPAGITSNCVSCHGVALVPSKSANYPPDYKVPIDFFHSPTYFTKSTTHVDFSWAVAGAP